MGPAVSLGWCLPTSQPPPPPLPTITTTVEAEARSKLEATNSSRPSGFSLADGDAGSRHGGTTHLSPTPPVARPYAPVLLRRGLRPKAAGTQRLANLRRHLPHIVFGEIVHRHDGCLVMVAEYRRVHARECFRSKPPLPLPLPSKSTAPRPGLDTNAVYATPHLLLFLFERCASDAVTDPVITVPEKVTAGTRGSLPGGAPQNTYTSAISLIPALQALTSPYCTRLYRP